MSESDIFEAVERIKIGLIAKATDGEYFDRDYKEDVQMAFSDSRVAKMLPSVLRTCRSTGAFRQFIQGKYKSYAERREYINQEFNLVFEYLESVKSGNDIFSENLALYELGDRLGCGGFGQVYKFHHKLLDHDFAIKVFEPVFASNEENTEGERRFFREAKVLFKLNHENIVQVYDIGRINGKPFIKMEYVDGWTLEELIVKKGAISFERSKTPVLALLNGLSFAHKVDDGVIHRDLKPSNVMAARDGRIKIIDFGVSAYIENEKHSKLTKTGERIAGGVYTDPALLVDPTLKSIRSDIYSVGAIWYFLVTGLSPAGGDVRSILLNSGNVTSLQSEVILKCLSSDPENRYQTCEELLQILQPIERKSNTGDNSLLNRLTEITREAIFDYLMETYDEESNLYAQFQTQDWEIFYYSGKRNDVTFLGRLYDLKNMPSADSRLANFEEEIGRHTIVNNDYEYGWVFRDDRLKLKDGTDEVLLKFLCEMFHPVIRSEKSGWQGILAEINKFIMEDGYEIYESEKISGRSVYSYRYKI